MPTGRMLGCSLAVLFISACGSGGGSSGAVVPPPPLARASAAPFAQISHVVVIVQENRSFDNLFSGYPGADTVASGPAHDGSIVQLQPVPLEATFDPDHSHWEFVQEYNNGKNDGWDQAYFANGAGASVPPNPVYAYVPRNESALYWSLAQQYTLADRMFQSNSGPSFPAHLYLVAGDALGVSELPTNTRTRPWGCDAPAGTTVALIAPAGATTTPCFDLPSLADMLDAKQLPWRYYTVTATDVWSAFDAVKGVRFGAGWANVVTPETTVLSDIVGGRLPAVSWVMPRLDNSDHSGGGSGGPEWVASIVNAIGQSPYWNSTAIVVTWDDWGGWYDHVVPPQLDAMGLGYRVPLLVVSPYAKRGYVSHVQHEFGSVLKFTEEVFGLPSLGKTDRRADNLSDMFDFTRAPRAFVPLATRRHVRDFLQDAPSHALPDNDSRL